ncbi:MAG: hypothetical protein EHM42_13400, partial [Planctomycetaceae bacterium]
MWQTRFRLPGADAVPVAVTELASEPIQDAADLEEDVVMAARDLPPELSTTPRSAVGWIVELAAGVLLGVLRQIEKARRWPWIIRLAACV